MAQFVALDFVFGNNSVLGSRIACLSNTHKNLFYILALGLISLNARICANFMFVFILLNLIPKANIVPALTNTVFSIHPPLLYASSFFILKKIYFKSRYSSYPWALILALATCLGGFWSMQELSWGGWWNWDVLECGIAFIVCAAILSLHKRNRISSASGASTALNLACAFYTYNLLNKLGLATSIHSFVTSKSVRNHYPAVVMFNLVLSCIYVRKALLGGLILSAIIYLSYVNLRWCIFLKKPSLMFVVTLISIPPRRNLIFVITHRPVLIFGLILSYVNAFNFSFLINLPVQARQLFTYANGAFFKFVKTHHSATIVVWENLFLSKPRFGYNTLFNSTGARNLNPRLYNLIFLK